MKNNIFILIILMISICLTAQNGRVGIATSVPNTTLDINGTLNVNNEINFGGTNVSSGTSGSVGSLISANGAVSPTWKNFDLPSGYLDGLVQSAAFIKATQNGISFNGTASGGTLSVPYNENQPIAANWKALPDVEQIFTVRKSNAIVNINVQTMAQINNGTIASYGCGIYIDDQLKFVRTSVVSGTSGSYRALNLNASIPNLTIGNHTFKFACAERNIATGVTLGIGTPVNATTLNSAMAGTSVTLKVLEPIQ